MRRRALAAWKKAGLKPISLHECRHTYASLMIAAGVPVEDLSEQMGHANYTITHTRYVHLPPGSGDRAARLLQALLDREADAQ